MKRSAALPLMLVCLVCLVCAPGLPGRAAQGGGARQVTVTLVRWPYT